MTAATWVLVEHVVSGQMSVGEYDHDRAQLLVNGQAVWLGDYFCLAELARVERDRRQDRVGKP